MPIPRRTLMLLGSSASFSMALRFLPGASLVLTACKRESPERVYVSTEEGNAIAVIDPDRQEVVTRIPVGKRPRGIKISRDGKLLYVALSGSPRSGPNVDESKLPPPDRKADGIGVVDLAAQKLVSTLPSGQDPETFDLSLDGKKLYVSNEETSELSEVDLEKKQVTRNVIVGGEPEGVTLRPDGRVVYVTSEEDGTVAAVDTTTFTVLGHIKVGRRPRSIVFAKNGTTAFVTNELDSSLTSFDAEKNQPRDTIRIDGSTAGPGVHKPMGAVLSPDGDHVFVSTGRGKAVAVLELRTFAVVRRIENVGTRPWGIGVSRDGKRLYTANGPSNDVSVIDVAKGSVVKRIPVDGLPWGIAVS
jgi:YVTN family beta-propeller protein